MLSRVLAFGFLWSLAKTMSEQGWILDVFSLEIRQNNVQKVSFCAERPLDTNVVNYYRFASPADPFQMFRDSMEVRWILDRVSQSVDASKTSGD